VTYNGFKPISHNNNNTFPNLKKPGMFMRKNNIPVPERTRFSSTIRMSKYCYVHGIKSFLRS
jgi:hypothetical protein